MSRVRLSGVLGNLGIDVRRRELFEGLRQRVVEMRVIGLDPETRDRPITLQMDAHTYPAGVSPHSPHPRATREAAEQAADTAAMLKILIHEFLEAVTVDGKRPLDPHKHEDLERALLWGMEQTIMQRADLFGAADKAWDEVGRAREYARRHMDAPEIVRKPK